MLEKAERDSLIRALGALEDLISIRLEERGGAAAGGTTPESLLARRVTQFDGVEDEAIPTLEDIAGQGPLGRLIRGHELSAPEALLIVALLAAEVDARFSALYELLKNQPSVAGVTGEVLRNLGARTFAKRLLIMDMLGPRARLRQSRIVHFEPRQGGGLLGGRFSLNPDLTPWLLGLGAYEPEYSTEFPAHRMHTVHTLKSLVVEDSVRKKLGWVIDRIRTRDKVLEQWGFARSQDNAAGLHVLFHGPPGTGKTMAAAILGNETGLPVFRVDHSALISKYIGETQKNLERIFERAEAQDWILCFDEADAIFGRRGEVNDARDRYANQDVSYLLQRLETFSGVTILTTNLFRNVDEAFLRRLHIQVAFPKPGAGERAMLWRGIVPDHLPMDEKIDLSAFAEQFAMTGAEIRNVVFHAAHRAAANGGVVSQSMLVEGIRAEFEKSGRALSHDGGSEH